MTEPARRLPVSGAKRLRNIVDSLPVATNRGGTGWGRQVQRGTPSAGSSQQFGIGTVDRITIEWYSDDVLADEGNIASWPHASTYDSEGDSIQFSSGRFYLFGEGIYSVTIRVIADQFELSTNSDQVVSAVAQVFDRPDPESFAASTRGNQPGTSDAGSMCASNTFYSEGGGLSGGGIAIFVRTNNLAASTDAGRVFVMVAIQKIIAFA